MLTEADNESVSKRAGSIGDARRCPSLWPLWRSGVAVAAICFAGVMACGGDDGESASLGATTGGATTESRPVTGGGGEATAPGSVTSTSTSTTTTTPTSTTTTTGEEGADDEGVGLFVAQGHRGRTLVSCDDGNSWVADQSADDSNACSAGYDCDHDAGAGRGITYGDGWFVANFGWGAPGDLRRSDDGADWDISPQERTFGGVAFGDGVFLAGSRQPVVSLDLGQSWQPASQAPLSVYNVRAVGHADVEGGRFILVGEDGNERDVLLTDDAGQSWWRPSVLPGSCGASMQTRGGIAASDTTILILGGDGTACTSVDGGQTWTATSMPQAPTSHLVWTGDDFVAFSRGTRWTSQDGQTWTPAPTQPVDLELGAVAVSDTGTYVGVRGAWQAWYDDQVFYRSDDGLQWEVLPPSAVFGGHPIRDIVFGRGETCPEA